MLDNYVYHTVVGSNSIYLLYVITNFSTLPCLLPSFKPRTLLKKKIMTLFRYCIYFLA